MMHGQLIRNLHDKGERRVPVANQHRFDFQPMQPLRMAADCRRKQLSSASRPERLDDPHFTHLRIDKRRLHDVLLPVEQEGRSHPS